MTNNLINVEKDLRINADDPEETPDGSNHSPDMDLDTSQIKCT